MSLDAWRNLLVEWSPEILADPELRDLLPPEVIASGWVGYPRATEEQIARAEVRLGTRLPPSYREFLMVSNGWRALTRFIYQLWSTDEIEWFRVRNQAWIDAWLSGSGGPKPVPDTEYLVYGAEQSVLTMRAEYLETALEVSDVGSDAIYLLNPRVVTPEGEWEAWFFASWLPGANRYRSFWEMLQAEHDQFMRMPRS